MQIWDSSGNLIMDTNTRMGRYLGTTSTGTANGSVTDARFTSSTGTPFWFINGKGDTVYAVPTVTYSANVLSWDWGTLPLAYRVDCILIYGVY